MAVRRNPDEIARERASTLPRDTWIITGTSVQDTYPCRCRERPAWAYGRRDWQCSPAFCPCAGRPDPPEPECCGYRVSVAEVVIAKAAWGLKRRREAEMLD